MSALPYRDLIVWQKAYRMAMAVLRLGEQDGLSRRWYFRDQVCRAAMSVPANIAEGNGRSTPLDYAGFLDRARASVFETDTWLLAAAEQGYIGHHDWRALESQLQELSAMLLAMAGPLRRKAKLGSQRMREF